MLWDRQLFQLSLDFPGCQVLLKPVFGCEMGCAGLTERPERLCHRCVIKRVCS